LFILSGQRREKKRKKFLLVQLKPSPEYPTLHEQLKLPIVFVQMAFSSHPPLFVKHSSTSIIINFLRLKMMKRI